VSAGVGCSQSSVAASDGALRLGAYSAGGDLAFAVPHSFPTRRSSDLLHAPHYLLWFSHQPLLGFWHQYHLVRHSQGSCRCRSAQLLVLIRLPSRLILRVLRPAPAQSLL